MKKLLFILGIALFSLTMLTSCENEDSGCSCRASWMTPNGGQFTVPNQTIDCNTRQPINGQQGNFFLGCQ
jgi:hypothetical protein